VKLKERLEELTDKHDFIEFVYSKVINNMRRTLIKEDVSDKHETINTQSSYNQVETYEETRADISDSMLGEYFAYLSSLYSQIRLRVLSVF
jgi:hypothetical protein